jgi:Tfp pilus assembly protein PilV
MPRKNPIKARALTSGTSLVELLVVIVVFLIGILAIAQIFPGGITILARTKNDTVANTLAHRELDRIRGFKNGLPEQIVPIVYTFTAPNTLVGTLADRNVDDFSVQGVAVALNPHSTAPTAQYPWNEGYSGWAGTAAAPIGGGTQSWDLVDAANQDLGPYSYLMGSNNIRRVIGEGGVVPAPLHIGSAYGALLPLEYGPAIWHASVNAGPTIVVYGNDMDKVEGVPAGALETSAGISTTTLVTGDYVVSNTSVPSYQYYVDDSTITDPYIYIPADVADPTTPHSFKITFVANINTVAGLVQRTYLVVSPILVPAPGFTPTGNQGVYYAFELTQLNSPALLNAGETLQSIDFSSIRLARQFDRIEVGATFNTNRTPDGTPQNPYQYQIRDVIPSNGNDAKRDTLGMLLINPTAYGYVEQTKSGQSILLQAKVDYDVFDWRILKEDFKAPDTSPYQYQLAIGNLKHHFGYEPDGTLYMGMGFEVPNEDGTPWDFEKRDVVVADLATGGVISKNSSQGGFDVNYSIGMLHFNPVLVQVQTLPAPPTLCLYEVLPDNNGATPVPVPISGLTLRVYYEANGEWASQPLKSAANYQLVTASPPLPGQIYVTPPTAPSPADLNAIEFPSCDIGATVTIDQVWYDASNSGGPEELQGQSFIVRPPDRNHSTAYITIRDIDPYAINFDYSNNYAVSGVKGLTLSVRVLWNPDPVRFDPVNINANLNALNMWGQGWRHITTEGILQRGSIEE